MKKKMYDLGIRLGVNKKDIDDILNGISTRDEQSYLSLGPNYPGGFYGTVSINDF